jgi:hypothetical protein
LPAWSVVGHGIDVLVFECNRDKHPGYHADHPYGGEGTNDSAKHARERRAKNDGSFAGLLSADLPQIPF